MTDDGCPLTPDPARWSDEDYGDNAVHDPVETDGAPLIATSPSSQPPSSHWDRLIARNLVRSRWRASGEQLTGKKG